ncbi:MAG: LacI family DNA-binding transcriptional regulator [Jiangellaceae bacterium]|nr:LacI family DNA-binding transcriptional regulator [Jiangellaceae bacterium]
MACQRVWYNRYVPTLSSPVQRARRPTLRDVAALAGVSYKTVSRVVNDEPGVSARLAERVRLACEQLDYHPDHTASTLRRRDRRTSTIGLILEDVSNPFSGSLHRAVEDVALDRGVTVLAGSFDEDPSRARVLFTAFARRRVDGLIVVPPSGDVTPLIMEQRKGTALVFLDRAPAVGAADAVVSDNRRGAATGVAHLIRHGHRRIGFLGDYTALWTAEERYQGYLDALATHGMAADPALVRRDVRSDEAAGATVSEMLAAADPATAFFAGQNLITMAAVRRLRALGRAHDLALVGFDDFQLADLLDPPVTVVAQDPVTLGHRAAELVFERIDGADGQFRLEVVPTLLLPRGSGEIPPSPR